MARWDDCVINQYGTVGQPPNMKSAGVKKITHATYITKTGTEWETWLCSSPTKDGE